MPLDGTADLEVDGETLDDALGRVNADISNLPPLTCFFQGKNPFTSSDHRPGFLQTLPKMKI